MYSFVAPVSMLIGQSATTQSGRPDCILAIEGYLGYGYHPFRIVTSFIYFLLSKGLETRNNCTPRTTKILKTVALGRANKHKENDNNKQLYLDLAKNLFIYLGFLYLHKCKIKMT
jgi:hypothetical protein